MIWDRLFYETYVNGGVFDEDLSNSLRMDQMQTQRIGWDSNSGDDSFDLGAHTHLISNAVLSYHNIVDWIWDLSSHATDEEEC